MFQMSKVSCLIIVDTLYNIRFRKQKALTNQPTNQPWLHILYNFTREEYDGVQGKRKMQVKFKLNRFHIIIDRLLKIWTLKRPFFFSPSLTGLDKIELVTGALQPRIMIYRYNIETAATLPIIKHLIELNTKSIRGKCNFS